MGRAAAWRQASANASHDTALQQCRVSTGTVPGAVMLFDPPDDLQLATPTDHPTMRLLLVEDDRMLDKWLRLIHEDVVRPTTTKGKCRPLPP